MIVGLTSASSQAKKIGLSQVYTGRWGCGVFAADQYLKFCIQWIACSECKMDMVFMADEENTLK